MERKRIYLGCSLTDAPPEFVGLIEQLRGTLLETYDVLQFLGIAVGTPQQVYAHDRNCVVTCDLFVAICDFPSLGLGMELGIATEIEKATLAVAGEGTKRLSRMPQGITQPNFLFRRYGLFTQIPQLVAEAFATIPSLRS